MEEEDRILRLLDVVPHIRNVCSDASKKLREHEELESARILDTAIKTLTKAADAFLTETQPITGDLSDQKENPT